MSTSPSLTPVIDSNASNTISNTNLASNTIDYSKLPPHKRPGFIPQPPKTLHPSIIKKSVSFLYIDEINYQISLTYDASIYNKFTLEELSQFNGVNPDMPIYLGFKCKVYDVTKGKIFYSPGNAYNALVGKDATRSLLTGCFKKECAIPDYSDLDPEMVRTGLKKFHIYGGKYPLIGAMDPKDCVSTKKEIKLAREVEADRNNIKTY